VRAILGKGNLVVGLGGHWPQLHGHAEIGQRRQFVVAIEVGDRPRSQREPTDDAVARLGDERVVDEVERDLDGAFAVRHRRGREPARREVEDDVPPVVLARRQSQTGLADHLHPHVKGVVGLPPLCEGQALRPDRRVGHRPHPPRLDDTRLVGALGLRRPA